LRGQEFSWFAEKSPRIYVVFSFVRINRLSLEKSNKETQVMSYFPKSRDEEIVVQSFNDEILIYDLAVNKAFCLNKTSMMVWQLCNGDNSIREIGQKLGSELKSPVSEDVVRLALDQLKRENLLENGEEFQIESTGLTRREIVRRAGLASMIALPLISSLLAPTAAMAVSCFNAAGSPPNTIKGLCQPGIGQPPATQQLCALTCQLSFGATCQSCTATAFPTPTPGTFQCRCA
jgi:hypothetical protein